MGNKIANCNWSRVSSSQAIAKRRCIWPNHHPVISNQKHSPARNEQMKYATNRVKTTKYSLLTFLPLNLYEQFHRFANIYFLFICLLNFMPEISAFAKEVAPVPVIIVLSITAVKDAYEDFMRYKADMRVNHSTCEIYQSSSKMFEKREWQQIRPGDIVRLRANQVIPADMLLLHSSDISGICHFETASLDGETNLKQREVIRGFVVEHFDPEAFLNCVEVETPNPEIYHFSGKVFFPEVEDIQPIPLKKENLVLRGCTIRNTAFVVGMVIYAGHETKAMLNSRKAAFKRSKLERQLNKDVIWCVCILILLCGVCALCSWVWLLRYEGISNVLFLANERKSPSLQAFLNFWTFIIIFQAMIPLPLYVSLELVKLGQVLLMRSDLELYDQERDQPVVVRAFNISEDLGQVQYIFSDKTGTLTENKMEFRRCSILGRDFAYNFSGDAASWSDSTAKTESDPLPLVDPTPPTGTIGPSPLISIKPILDVMRVAPPGSGEMAALNHYDKDFMEGVKDFFLLLALCNTVVVSNNKNAPKSTRGSLAPGASMTVIRPKHKSRQLDKITETNEASEHPPLHPKPKRSMPGNHFPPVLKIDFNGPRLDESEQLHENLYPQLPQPVQEMRNPEPEPQFLQQQQQRKQSVSFPPSTTAEVISPNVASFAYDTQLDSLIKSYEAESPDEMELVRVATICGCRLLQRAPEFVTLWMPGQGEFEVDVMHTLPFDSDRKRMSIIFRHPLTQEVVLLTKGADTAMFSVLSSESIEQSMIITSTKQHISSYAHVGLRTLVMGKRIISSSEYAKWRPRFDEAQSQGDEVALGELMMEIERNLDLLGATGIEDRLQDGVPETIASLRAAGIHVWVLTGDKQETALNISFTANLLTEQHRVIVLNSNSTIQVHETIRSHLAAIEAWYPLEVEIRQRHHRPPIREDLALCVDGATLTHALQPEVKFDFLRLAEQCSSVVCCRATPSQKAEVVKLVKDNLKMQTLAIGDGANDVNMIRTADVGIGISGQEGMQAVMASDFALARFKHIKRLLLVHGYCSYDKLARIGLYIFYKCTVFIMLMFWFQIFAGFSGQTMLGQLYQVSFNLIFTSIPPLIMGVIDNPLKPGTLFLNPAIYYEGQNCFSYLPWYFWLNIADAVYQSGVWFFLSFLVFYESELDLWMMGDCCTSIAVLASLGHAFLETKTLTALHWLGLSGSLIVCWYLFAMVFNSVCVTCLQPESPYMIIFMSLQEGRYWLCLLLATVVSLLPRVTVRVVCNTWCPTMTERARQLEKELGHSRVLPLKVTPKVYPIIPEPPATSEKQGKSNVNNSATRPRRPVRLNRANSVPQRLLNQNSHSGLRNCNDSTNKFEEMARERGSAVPASSVNVQSCYSTLCNRSSDTPLSGDFNCNEAVFSSMTGLQERNHEKTNGHCRSSSSSVLHDETHLPFTH